MKRFTFRLERTLHWKQQQERLAQQQLLQARAAIDIAEAAVWVLEQQLAQLAARMRLDATGQPISWMDYRLQALNLGERLDQAIAQARQARQHFDEASAHWRKISQEVELLLQLRRQQWQAYCQEMQRAEQVQLDEIGLNRWFLTQDDGVPIQGQRPVPSS